MEAEAELRERHPHELQLGGLEHHRNAHLAWGPGEERKPAPPSTQLFPRIRPTLPIEDQESGEAVQKARERSLEGLG